VCKLIRTTERREREKRRKGRENIRKRKRQLVIEPPFSSHISIHFYFRARGSRISLRTKRQRGANISSRRRDKKKRKSGHSKHNNHQHQTLRVRERLFL
jgi:hypothetical protein